ncbi:HAMP domain-containing sensor histidine kinase [Jeotgalibacillus marinus]|uniref:Signal transduction histidine-protein kinase ArlS n=1 Tax=Jeotgalibacillus marinus TaxID=86667 RepID=A0ABV3Q366_9BACL
MNRLTNIWNNLSLRWKWTIAGGASIFLAFTTFSIILIISMSQLMFQEEKSSVDEVLDDLASFYKNEYRVTESGSIEVFDQIYEKGQTIRLYNQDGSEVLSFQGEVPSLSLPFTPTLDRQINRMSVSNQDVLVGRSPIRSQQYIIGYAEVIHPLTMYKSMRNYMILLSLVFGLGALLFSAVIAYFMAGRFISPVVALGHAMRKTQKEGFQKRLEIPVVQDEVGGLVEVFNDMMDELEATFMKQRQFVEDASHELRTPIQIIEGHLSLINRWGKEDPAVLAESLGISIQELDRIKRLVNELLTLTKADREVVFSANAYSMPHTVVSSVVTRIHELHPDRIIHMSLAEKEPPVALEAHHIEQVLFILIENALKYSAINEAIEIKTLKTNDQFSISIQDHGIGIPEEDLPFIFDRFYRVDKARSRDQGGNGLGLSIAQRILKVYGAQITASSRHGHGTTMTIYLPLVSQSDR